MLNNNVKKNRKIRLSSEFYLIEKQNTANNEPLTKRHDAHLKEFGLCHMNPPSSQVEDHLQKQRRAADVRPTASPPSRTPAALCRRDSPAST